MPRSEKNPSFHIKMLKSKRHFLQKLRKLLRGKISWIKKVRTFVST